jgi:hypothetical protein
MKSTSRTLIGGLAAVAVLGALAYFVIPNPAPDTPVVAAVEQAPAHSHESATPSEPQKLSPDEQPRSYFVMDFSSPDAVPDDFALEGVVPTDNGVVLSAEAEKSAAGTRTGVLESTVQQFDFPTNSIVPLWKEEVPEGTEIVMEYSVSPDGTEWSDWYEFHPSHESEISPTYPDGRPNPNYGYTSGGIITFDNHMKGYFRFRARLTSESEASPVFSGVRVYYQDSTLVDRRS